MITETTSEFLHLLKTKKGIEKSLNEKKVDLSKDCREIISSHERPPHLKKMAELILELTNGK